MANDTEGGTALAAWLVTSSLAIELVRSGTIERKRAAVLMDNAQVVLEQGLARWPDLRELFQAAIGRIDGLQERLRGPAGLAGAVGDELAP